MKIYTNRNNVVVSKQSIKTVLAVAAAVAVVASVVYITTDIVDIEMSSNVVFEKRSKTIEVPYYSMSRLEQLDSEK